MEWGIQESVEYKRMWDVECGGLVKIHINDCPHSSHCQ